MHIVADQLLRGLIAPALVAVMAMLVLGRRPDPDVPRHSDFASAIGAGAAFFIGFAALFGIPSLPPVESWKWLVYLALPSIALGMADCLALRASMRWGIRTGAALPAAWMLVPTFASIADERPAWIAVLAILILATWGTVDRAIRAGGGAGQLAGLILILSSSAPLMVLSRNAGFAQVAGVLAAAVGGVAVIAAWRREAAAGRGLAASVALVFPGLVLNSYFLNYGDVPAASFALVGAAPIMAAAGGIIAALRTKGWRLAAIQIAAGLLPAGAGIGLALATGSPDSGSLPY